MDTFAGARHEREPLETHGAGGPALHVLSAILSTALLFAQGTHILVT